MTLHDIKYMQASRRESNKLREQLRKQFKTDDPHDTHAWGGNRPWWVRPLQALGVIAMSIGLFILMDYALWSIRIVLSL